MWVFPERLCADYSVLWVEEGEFKAANAYQINSGFQEKNCSGLFCAYHSCRVRHGFISHELAGWEYGIGGFCNQSARTPWSSNTSFHFCSRV